MSGVPGLSRCTIRGGGFCEGDVRLVDYELKYSRLVVDGNSLAWRLFDSRQRKSRDHVESEEQDGGKRQVQELFRSLLEDLKLVIIVIRDEQSEADSQAASATNASGENIRANWQAPLDMVKMIRSVASEMVFRIETCNGSIHDRVAELSLEHRCPVISDDGYFFCKAPQCGVIPWDSYDHKSKSCELFRLDQKSLLNSEFGLAKLSLINVLAGPVSSRDENQERVLRLIRNKLVFITGPSDCKRFKGSKWNQRVLAGVLSQLCERTFEEAREYVVNLVDKSDKKTVEAIINKGSYDLYFYQTARELREAIEDVCGCQHHNQVRVAQWIEWLYMQTARPIPLSSTLFLPFRTELTDRKLKNASLSQPQRKDILLRGLHCSTECYLRHLHLWHGVEANQEDDFVQEFFTVKLLSNALELESPNRKLSKVFTRATLSCLVHYLGDENNFLAECRERLVEDMDDLGYRLRTPLNSISACKLDIFKQMETLIELIWTFNELNALAGHPMRQLRPEKWLNICLIYNLAEGIGLLGKLPDEFKLEFELELKPPGETVHNWSRRLLNVRHASGEIGQSQPPRSNFAAYDHHHSGWR